MRLWHIGLAVGLVMSLMLGTGLAQTNEQRPAPPVPGGGLHQALDVDGDGVLSAEEIAGAAAALAALDADGDGVVSREELCGEGCRGPRGRIGQDRRAPFGGRGFVGRPPLPGQRFDGFGAFGGAGFRGWSPRASRSGGRVGRPWPGGFHSTHPMMPGRGGAGFGRDGGPPEPGFMLDRLFERFDEAGEGYLSEDAVPAMLWQRLSQADADGDGKVTREEAQASADALRERAGADRPRGRGPQPRSDSER